MTQREKIVKMHCDGLERGVKITYIEIAKEVGCAESFVARCVTDYNRREHFIMKFKVECKCPTCGKRHFVMMIRKPSYTPRIFCLGHDYLRYENEWHCPDGVDVGECSEAECHEVARSL